MTADNDPTRPAGAPPPGSTPAQPGWTPPAGPPPAQPGQWTPPAGPPPVQPGQWTPPAQQPPQPQWTPPGGAPAQGWAPPGAPQPAGPQPARKGRGIQKRWIVLAVVVVVAGVFFYQTWQQEQNYQTGHAAYLAADCDAAREPLRKAADGEPGSDESDTALKARAELQECDALLAASQLADGEAVLAYRDFVNKYPGSPLVETGRTGAQELLASSSAVATTALCDELPALEQEDFIASPADTLPPLLLACGEAYEADAAFADALAAYTRFRTEFADHDLADEVEAAYARATLAEAEAAGAGELPPPIDTGTEGGVAGQATIVIQNDSPDVLAMVFSGPDVRVEEIEPCGACEEFFGDEPEFCPELGPIAEYIVEPGTYEVVVKSGSGADVIPFRGTWTLEAGQVYDSCFYIVTTP